MLCALVSKITSTLGPLEAESDEPKHMSSNAWLNRTGFVMFRTQYSGVNVLADISSFPITGDANRVPVHLVLLGIGGWPGAGRYIPAP